jgi:hypothetical protein
MGKSCFSSKKDASAIHDLILWSEKLQDWEEQKKFLQFCIEMFRQALMMNYETKALVYFEPKVDKFKLEKFAPLSMEIILMLFLKNSLTLCITWNVTEMLKLF